MQGPIRCVLVAGLVMGCSGDDTTVPPMLDAPVSGSGGLVVTWSTSPATWPSTLNGITLDRADFAIDSLRVVGDAGPGDPRTTATAFMIRWDDNSAPDDLMFSDAPTGLYSQVSMAIDGHLSTESFEIRGTATAESETKDFEISSDNPLAITVQIDRTLMPPDIATVQLRIDFTHALSVIDFKDLDSSDGEWSLEDGDDQMAAFRQALGESFEVADGGSGGGVAPVR
jgi:hypothetical protein